MEEKICAIHWRWGQGEGRLPQSWGGDREIRSGGAQGEVKIAVRLPASLAGVACVFGVVCSRDGAWDKGMSWGGAVRRGRCVESTGDGGWEASAEGLLQSWG